MEKHLQLSLSELSLSKREINLSLGYGRNQPDQLIEEIINQELQIINQFCRPSIYLRILDGDLVNHSELKVLDTIFLVGEIIGNNLHGISKFCLFVVTTGIEFDEYKKDLRKQNKQLEEFVADAIGSVIAESCVDYIHKYLQGNDLKTTLGYSPGYCGWRLEEQKLLLSLLPTSKSNISLSESSLMTPMKSVSGILGVGKNVRRKGYSCGICTLDNCYKRKQKRMNLN